MTLTEQYKGEYHKVKCNKHNDTYENDIGQWVYNQNNTYHEGTQQIYNSIIQIRIT